MWSTESDFPGSSVGKESSCNAEDMSSIPGSGRSPGERNVNSLQYPCLENSVGRGIWRAIVHEVTKSQTGLNQTGLTSHTVEGFSVVNETEVDAFLEFPCIFCDPMDVGNLISSSSTFPKSSLYIWKFLVDILLKPTLKDFEHYLASMRNEWNCVVVLTFFGIALLWDWNENWPFPVLWPLLSFPNLLTIFSKLLHSISLYGWTDLFNWSSLINIQIVPNKLILQVRLYVGPSWWLPLCELRKGIH